MAPLLEVRRFLSIGSLAMLAILALLPQPWKGRLATHGQVHDFAHIGAFLLVFVLIAWEQRNRALLVLSAILLLAFGAVLEALETSLYGNLLEYRDIASNTTGIALGFLVRSIWK